MGWRKIRIDRVRSDGLEAYGGVSGSDGLEVRARREPPLSSRWNLRWVGGLRDGLPP